MPLIAELLDKLDAQDWRQTNIPIEAAQSHPFLSLNNGQLSLVVFYYRVTGPPRERSSFPPRWLATITVDGTDITNFRHIQKTDFAFDVLGFEDDDEPVEIQTGTARLSYSDRTRKEDELREALQSIAPIFLRPVRELTPAQRGFARTYLERLKELVSVQWRGYYLSLGKECFSWTMSASGVKLIDPPPGSLVPPQ